MKKDLDTAYCMTSNKKSAASICSLLPELTDLDAFDSIYTDSPDIDSQAVEDAVAFDALGFDPIDTEDTLDLTEMLKDYAANIDNKRLLKGNRGDMSGNIAFHIAPAKSVYEDIQPDCGYIIISTDDQYDKTAEDSSTKQFYNQYNKLSSYPNVLLLHFADTEERTRRDSISVYDACRILFFIDNCRFNDVFVSCDAGESRSPAVVAAVLKAAGEEDDYIWKSNDYRPNVNVYRTILERFGRLPDVEKEIETIESMTAEEYREYRKRQN